MILNNTTKKTPSQKSGSESEREIEQEKERGRERDAHKAFTRIREPPALHLLPPNLLSHCSLLHDDLQGKLPIGLTHPMHLTRWASCSVESMGHSLAGPSPPVQLALLPCRQSRSIDRHHLPSKPTSPPGGNQDNAD